jgi:hypothetical protein
MGRRILRRMVFLPTLVAGTVVAWAGAAAAQSGPPGEWAAVAQYVELIPTSTGAKAAGGPGPTKPLPKSLATQFARRGGNDAKALETLVTSSGWAASTPQRASRAAKPTPEPTGGEVLAVPLPQEGMSAPESVGDALAGGGRATFALVALLVLVTAFTLARLRARRR